MKVSYLVVCRGAKVRLKYNRRVVGVLSVNEDRDLPLNLVYYSLLLQLPTVVTPLNYFTFNPKDEKVKTR